MLFTRLLEALPWPSLCAVCHDWGQGRVCGTCVSRFAPTVTRCPRCALFTPSAARVCGACVVRPPPFAAAVAAVDYEPPWDSLITRFKFHGELDLAPVLAHRLALAVAQRASALPVDLVLPVPLSASRLRERGFNQAWELAHRVGLALQLTADNRLLRRIKDSPHQLALASAERADNVRGVFAVEPLRVERLRGRHLALVDDVMTTTSTAAEATRVLLEAGAASVQAWAVGRTPRPTEA